MCFESLALNAGARRAARGRSSPRPCAGRGQPSPRPSARTRPAPCRCLPGGARCDPADPRAGSGRSCRNCLSFRWTHCWSCCCCRHCWSCCCPRCRCCCRHHPSLCPWACRCVGPAGHGRLRQGRAPPAEARVASAWRGRPLARIQRPSRMRDRKQMRVLQPLEQSGPPSAHAAETREASSRGSGHPPGRGASRPWPPSASCAGRRAGRPPRAAAGTGRPCRRPTFSPGSSPRRSAAA
mmetsp:Transcript_8656/g.30938  ORF Transcript_8656/g.30938 Transcript_8656/m.30938 type:complete len:238 (+) Transcript_8656:2361-3074(+)